MNTNPRQLSAGYARAEDGIRHVFVRDLALIAMVGIYEHEKKHPQRILVNIDCAVQEAGGPLDDDIKNVVSYEKIVKNIKSIVMDGHVNLVETLAEKIAEKVLKNKAIIRVRVRVEKLDIIAEASSVGIEIERTRG
ncbi:MAG: dihydroneopterin aldolase [Anderseniella sp.]|jgi:7,8-dihydroneopterin aldolase/epimerase/oxygenase